MRVGGCNARYGVRFRWDMLCRRHPRWADPPEQQQLAVLPRQKQAFIKCDTCQRWHRPTAATMAEGIRCSTLISPSLRTVRKLELRAVEAEVERGKQTEGSTFSSCHHRTSRPHPMEETVSYYHKNRSRSDETNGSARSEGGQERWLTKSYVDKI